MIIAVDFDGTIVRHKFPEIGEEIPNAINILKFFQGLGHQIIIWTCREEKYLNDAITFLNGRGFYPDAINENIIDLIEYSPRKIYADIYVDDRNFPSFIEDMWENLRDKILIETISRKNL